MASRSLARTARRLVRQLMAVRELIAFGHTGAALTILGDAQARAERLAAGARKPSLPNPPAPGACNTESRTP